MVTGKRCADILYYSLGSGFKRGGTQEKKNKGKKAYGQIAILSGLRLKREREGERAVPAGFS